MPRYENIYEYESDLAGKGLTVGIVMSRFNQDICEGLLAACTLTALTLPSASAASATSEPAVPSGCSVGAYGITPEGETIQR